MQLYGMVHSMLLKFFMGKLIKVLRRIIMIFVEINLMTFSFSFSIFSIPCSLRMYNSLVERCFTDCVDSFRRKSLDKQEEACVRRCAEKFLKHSMRVGMRFAELNQGAATPD